MKGGHTLILLAAFAWSAASSAYSFEFLTSLGPGMGETELLSRSSASTLVNIPSGGLERDHWHVEFGASRMFALSELDRAFVAGVYRWREFTVGLGLMQFGQQDLYAERTLKTSLAYQYDSMSFGVTVSGMMVDIAGGYGQLRAATFGLGTSMRRGQLYGSLVLDNITKPTLVDGSLPIEPTYSLYGEFMSKSSFSVTIRGTWENNQPSQYGLGQRIRLNEQASFFWGLATEPLKYGGGLQFSFDKLAISYATTVHPVLGLTHTVTLSYGSRSEEKGSDEFDNAD